MVENFNKKDSLESVGSLKQENFEIAEADKEYLVGDMLKKVRTKKGLSSEEVAKRLCIKQSYIELIESNVYGGLPGEAYALGFVKSYSVMLGLDESEMLSLYKKEISSKSYLNHKKREMEELGMGSMMPKFGMLLISLVVLVVAYCVWYTFTIKDKSDETPSYAEEIVETVEENKQENTNTETHDLADSLLLESLEKVDLQNVLSETTIPDVSTTPKKDEKEVNKKGRISLKSVDDAWMKLSRGRETLFSGMLKKNESYEIPYSSNDEAVIMDTGNAGGIEIYVDGKLINKAGVLSEVKRGVILDASSLIEKKGL
ncbi:MAG: Cytoskeleton protein RodZ [Alphaproteobacteria bacterium ADurb.Bin438]|nr:MAG: Cytoskeleton protein RodZ [Alphaproteobacteria bacterium ADurb.Bin438]